jgi:predicted RNase H-like HicB family nuclease
MRQEQDMAFTAIAKHDGPWWIGWIKEMPGVNCQERTHAELLESLKSALEEALEFNRADAIAAAGIGFTEEPIAL